MGQHNTDQSQAKPGANADANASKGTSSGAAKGPAGDPSKRAGQDQPGSKAATSSPAPGEKMHGDKLQNAVSHKN